MRGVCTRRRIGPDHRGLGDHETRGLRTRQIAPGGGVQQGEGHQTPCIVPGFSSLGTRTYFPAPTTIGSDPSPHSSSPSFAAVDAWTTEHAKTFNATTFEVKFGDTVVPAVFTDAAPTVDGAWGTSHAYEPVAFEVASLLETVAIPDMQAMGMLPDKLPTLGEIKANVRVPVSAASGTGGEDGDGDGDTDGVGGTWTTPPTTRRTTPRQCSNTSRPRGSSPSSSNEREEEGRRGARGIVSTRHQTGERRGVEGVQVSEGGILPQGNVHHVRGNLEPLRQGEAGRRNVEIGRYLRRPRLQPAGEVGRAGAQADPSPDAGERAETFVGAAHGRGPRGLHDGHDPLFTAMNLTGGSLFFAESAAESSAMATVMLIVGVAMLVPATVLGYPHVRQSLGGGARGGSRRYRQGRGIERDQFDDVL